MNILKNKKTKELLKVILALNNQKEAGSFFRDLLTESEIKEFANRWKAVKMLDKKIPYTKIEAETGLSSTTIARISKWLRNGSGGYRLMLKKLSSDHRHGPSRFGRGLN